MEKALEEKITKLLESLKEKTYSERVILLTSHDCGNLWHYEIALCGYVRTEYIIEVVEDDLGFKLLQVYPISGFIYSKNIARIEDGINAVNK